MKQFVFVFSLIFFLGFTSSARILSGNEGAHGGDGVAIEFESALLRALDNSEKMNLFLGSAPEKIKTALRSTQIIVVDIPLVIRVNGVAQESVAINYRSTKTIQINRSKWNDIIDPHIHEGIALHEVLSLLELEGTGLYTYSSQYVALFNLSSGSISQVQKRGVAVYCGDADDFINILCPSGHLFCLLKTHREGLSHMEMMIPKNACEISVVDQSFNCTYEKRTLPLALTTGLPGSGLFRKLSVGSVLVQQSVKEQPQVRFESIDGDDRSDITLLPFYRCRIKYDDIKLDVN